MFRPAGILILGAVAASAAFGQQGALDPAFAALPFHEWFQGGAQARIHWSARISQPVLSVHQRLVARVEFTIDGAELAKRRGKGSLLLLVEFEDQQGRRWQDHDSLDLERMTEGVKGNDIQYLQTFFATPGDYKASFAIYDSATEEHSVIRRNFHVGGLHDDPLAGAWENLPAIEFVRSAPTPDSWYLPFIRSRLEIKAAAKEPVTLDVVVNLTPSERLEGSARVQNRNLAVLIPALKVISQIQWSNVSVNVSLLDLAGHKVVYEQSDVKRINWRTARTSLGQTNPGLIDVKALGERDHEADFFVGSIRKKAEDAESAHKSHVLIVLSSPVGFEPGQELHPMEAIPHAGLKTYYIRYQPLLPLTAAELGRMDSRRRMPQRDYGPLVDQLEPLLKPIEPKLFDVETPEQFRKVLAGILVDIGKM